MRIGKIFPALLAAGVLLAALLATLPPTAPAGAQTDHQLYLPLLRGGNPIPNGDFESGRTVWSESSKWDNVLIVTDQELPGGIAPHGGNWAAWLGGDDNEQATIEQSLFVDPQYPYLAYWQWLDWPFPCADPGALFTVSLGGTILAQTEVCDATTTGGYVHVVLDAGAFAGQSATLRFQLTTPVNNFANVFLDDVTLQSAP